MTEESATLLLGYKESIRRYLLQATIICGALCLVLLFFEEIAPIPLLLAAGSLTGELWWRSKKSLCLVDKGLKYGEEFYSWEDIVRYTTWGPVGIPWTPIKLEGLTIYFKNGTSVSLYSRIIGYEQLLQKLKSLSYPPAPEPLWYRYPDRVLRVARYAIASTFALFILLLISLQFLVILAVVIAGYFVIRSFVKNKREKGETMPRDAWIAAGGSITLLCLLFFIFKSPYLLMLLGSIPVLAVIWVPWTPAPLALISESLFVDKKRAYPLRHLRTVRMVSRFFVIKIWQLTFANGDVAVVPILENFEEFRQKLENQWNDVQKRYQGKKMSEEEAEVRPPEEEARKIYFFQADQITLQMPLAWQFWLPFFFIVHLGLVTTCLWCVYGTPIGQVALVGILLRELTPIFLIVYGSYLLFSLLPRLLALTRKYEINEDGIYYRKRHIGWAEIHSVLPHRDADRRQRVALFDCDGRRLLTICEEMGDWQLALTKIRKEVKAVHKANPVVEGAVAFLNQRANAWRHSRRLLVVLAIIIALTWSLRTIIYNNNLLAQQGEIAVTAQSNYILPQLFGKNLLMIPYQDFQGRNWYALAFQKDAGDKPVCTQIIIRYLPQNPIYVLPSGKVESPLVSWLNFWEARGVRSQQIAFLENLIGDMVYLLWVMAAVIIIVAVLHRGLFAGLLLQKMPPPLGPDIYLPRAIILQNTIRLVLHLVLIVLLAVAALSMLIPAYLPWHLSVPIPFPLLWVLTACILPVILCPYLAYYWSVVVPEWLRSFKRWRLDEGGLHQGKISLLWSEIDSIAVIKLPSPSPLRLFRSRRRQVAIINAGKKQIILEGTLVHFQGLVSHIRQQSKCRKDDYSKARYLLRQHYSLPKLMRSLVCMAMILLLPLLISFVRYQQRSVLDAGRIVKASVIYSFLGRLALLSYADSDGGSWYTLAWKTRPEIETQLRINNGYPAFWEGADWQSRSFRRWFGDIFPVTTDFLLRHSLNILRAFYLLLALGLLALLLPALWYLIGTVWGIPPLHPDKLKT